jgi:hypothetical protein
MDVQHKITSYGLNQHDQVILKSFLKVLNLDPSSPWIYSDEENAEVVLVDSEREEGKEFVYGCQIGIHNGKVMISVGENMPDCQSAHTLTRPLSYGGLHKVFDELTDVNGGLVANSIYYGDEHLWR